MQQVPLVPLEVPEQLEVLVCENTLMVVGEGLHLVEGVEAYSSELEASLKGLEGED